MPTPRILENGSVEQVLDGCKSEVPTGTVSREVALELQCPQPYWVAWLLDGVRVVQPEFIEDLGYLEILSLASGLHEIVDSWSVVCERPLLGRKVVLPDNVGCTSL